MRRIIAAGLCTLLILLTACALEAPSGEVPPDASGIGAGSGGSVVEYDGWVYVLSADMTSADAANLYALPPGQTAPILWPEAGYVQSIYAVDGALYFSRYGGTLTCPAGGGEMTAFISGMLVGLDEREGAFYYTRQGKEGAEGLYRIAFDGSDDRLIFEGSCTFLTCTDSAVYFYILVGEELTLCRAEKDGTGLTILSRDPALSDDRQWGGSEITAFSFCDGWMVWVQGSYQGSAGVFYGTLMRARPDGSEKAVLLTRSSAGFVVSDGWIYYDNFADPVGKEDEGRYRIRPDQGGAQPVSGEGAQAIFADNALYYSKNAALRTSGIDGTDARDLFDSSGMGAEFPEAYDSSSFCYPVAVLGDWVYFTAEVYGYPPGSSLHGTALESRFYRVRRDGGELQLLHEKDYLRDGYLYFRRDDAVNEAVERILGRTVDTLTQADLDTMSEVETLIISGQIHNLTNLRAFFPNLNHLRLSLYQGGLDADACAVLDSLPYLRGISVYASDEIASLDFLEELTYAALGGVDFAAAVLCGSEVVREHMTGTVGDYVRILDGDMAYELVSARLEDGEGAYLEHESFVFVSRKGADGYAVQTVIEENNVENETGLVLCDIDFDGQKDILIMLGHFGAQGVVCYSGYLRRGEGFISCPSFAEIPNPSVDAAGQKILSTWRNWAASHSWAMYEFRGGEFVRTDCLTGDVALEYENEVVGRYTDEGLVDGVWQTRKVLNTMDNSEDEIWEEIYADGGYWGLEGDRWSTLYICAYHESM